MAQPEYGAEIAGIYSKLENKKVESPKCFSLHHNLRSICMLGYTYNTDMVRGSKCKIYDNY